MAGIEDIKLWRSEVPMGDWMNFDPNHPTLGWKYPYQGRWFTGDKGFAQRWMGADNIIKELDIKSPIPLTKEYHGPTQEFWEWKDPEYAPKTIKELVRDQKILKNWVPSHGMGSGLDKLYQATGELSNYKDEGHKVTKLEQYLRWKDQNRWITLTVPKEIAEKKAKVNIYESIMKNLRKPRGFMSFSENRLGNILKLPKKIKYLNQLNKAGVPMHSGIPWSTIGQRIINNPVTRTAGWLGNVALGGMTLSDVYAGTNTVGNMATDLNRLMNVPTDRQGRVIQNVPTYRNLQNVAQRDVLNPNEMRGVTSFDTTKYDPHTMNAGGIASLML